MNGRRLLLFPLLWAGAGCAPITVWTEYSHKGLMGADASRPAHAVRTWEDVKVYYQAAAEGFMLWGSEPIVVEGYDHVVLGRLRVRRKAGSCDGMSAADLTAVQRDILHQLKAKAFDVGGNAVIYAESIFGTETQATSVSENECRAGTMIDIFGNGWAVIVKPKTPPAAQPDDSSQHI